MRTRNSYITVYFVVFLTLGLAVSTIMPTATAITPTSNTQTLLSSLTPEKATLGQTINWLVWTDPSLPGQAVTLTITDQSNSTTLSGYPSNIDLGSTNGSRIVTVSTAGFTTHRYRFRASTISGNMKLTSSRYENFAVSTTAYSVFASLEPSSNLLPGDVVDLTLSEYPDVDATANVTLGNSTHRVLKSWPNIAIPASNGSRTIRGISTTGLKAGNYQFKVNATSSIGKDTASTPLGLDDIIVDVEEFSYIVGEQVNVTIRTYPTVLQANLSMYLFNYTTFDQTTFLDEEVTLTNGRAGKLYDSTSWPVDRRKESVLYYAMVNATVSGRYVENEDLFFLNVFDTNVDTDESSYLAGQTVTVTTTTTPSQAGATLRLRVSNSSDPNLTWRTIGPVTLGADGKAIRTFDTTGWPADNYKVEASVVNGNNFMRNDTASFNIYLRTFNILATLDASTYTDFTVPALTISTSPGQTNANMTLTVDGIEGEYYEFIKTGFDSTTYLYGVPLLKQPNGTDYIEVKITSSAGTNDTSAILHYTHSASMSVIPESFLLETMLLVGSSPVVYYAVRKRRKTS